MKKGRLVNINLLPKISIEDDTGKLRIVQLAGISISPLQNFAGDLSAHMVLRKYLYQSIEYQVSKGTNKAKIHIPSENKQLGLILLQSGVAKLQEYESLSSNLHSEQELLSFKAVVASSKPELINGIFNKDVVKKSKLIKPGHYNLIHLDQNIIVARDNVYFSVKLRNIELSCNELESQMINEFIRNHYSIEAISFRVFQNLITKQHTIQAVFSSQFELDLIKEGFGKLTIKGASQLSKQVYQKAIQYQSSAKLNYKGFWKNYLDIYSLIYVKTNFLGKIIEVLEGHIYRIKNLINNKIMTVQLSTVICPIGQELGAYEARQFSRKQFIGKLFNVYIKKQTAYSIQAVIVRLDDHQPLDKIILSQGWGFIKVDSKNQSQTVRLQELVAKSIQSKVGLHSSAKKKVGIVRFEDLTCLNNKQTIERARQFTEGLLQSNNIDKQDIYFKGIIEGFKNNDIFKVKLNSKKAIINVQIEGVKSLDSKLMVKEYKTFRDSSLNFLEDNFLQRDVDIRIIQFNKKSDSFIGEMKFGQVNVAETLLEEGLVYIDDSWYVPNIFQQKEDVARLEQKGVWNNKLLKLRKKQSKEDNHSVLSAIISEIRNGNIVFYQTLENKNKLVQIVTPAMKEANIPLPKQQIKIGNICAAPFEDALYRVRITGFKKKNNNVVEVLYIDYGNSGEVNKNQLFAIPEELMMLEDLAVNGKLLFLKRLKESNQNYDAVFDQIQNILLDRQFNIQIIDDSLLLFQKSNIQDALVLNSVNAKMLNNGLLKLNKKELYEFDDDLREELINMEKKARDNKRGSWMAYESQSQLEDQLKQYIQGEKAHQSKKKRT